MTTLMAHQRAEEAFSRHVANGEHDDGMDCQLEEARNAAYEVFTKKPHPSALGRGGSIA